MREERTTGERSAGGCCNPEEIFDLAEGNLDPERRRVVRSHIESCNVCEARYEREVSLSAGFCAGHGFFPKPATPKCDHDSVSREVVMNLPTRSRLARLAWGILAVGILAVTVFAFGTGGDNLFFVATGGAESFIGYVTAVSDVFKMVLAFVTPFLLVALAVGLVLDLLIGAVVFVAARRVVVGSTRTVRSTEHTRGV